MGWFSNNFGNPQYIKYLLFVLNFLFVITGIVLIGIGSSVSSSYSTYKLFLDDQFFSIPTLLVTIGVIIFVIAFFGCYGAMRENYCMILTFSALMTVIFLLELIAGIYGYHLRGKAADVLKEQMAETMTKYPVLHTETKSLWDAIQKDYTCCGIDGPQDWVEAWKKMANHTDWVKENALPLSCCYDGLVGTVSCAINSTTMEVWNEGCWVKTTSYIQGHALQLGGFGLGIAFCQVMGIGFALFLAKTVKKNYLNM